MSKVRELYEAVRHEREGKGADFNETVTCDSALREAGVDAALIAKKLKEQLDAKQARWNPEKRAFELFPDNDVRLSALREVIKICGGYPSETEVTKGLVIYLGPLTPKEFRNGSKPEHTDSKGLGIAPEAPPNGADATKNITCASALRQIGVDENFIAKKLKEQLQAKQPRWNPKKKEYELLADNDARIAATREVVKIIGGYPSDESENDEGTVIVKPGYGEV